MTVMPSFTPRWHGEPPCYITSELLDSVGLAHLFTTRHFPGVRPFRDPGPPFGPDAWRALRAAGFGPEPAAFLSQVHGADVVRAERGGPVGRADAVMTERPGLPLAIFTADCLPIVIHDPAGGRVAGVHAGWRGTVQSVAGATVAALVASGGRPGDFIAAVGPSIGPCCYEVDGPVIERFERAFPEGWQAWATPKGPGKWMLDLWQANEDQLTAAGMSPSRVDNPRLCTGCRPDLFFSYRREQDRGRLVTVAAIPDGRGTAC